MRHVQGVWVLAGFCAAACSGPVTSAELCEHPLPYASELVSFSPGSGAGFGQEGLPAVVLGPPAPGGPDAGSTDVVSLGEGGEIVVGFGDRLVFDGPGTDLVIFENAFWVGGDPTHTFAELGAVAVSVDGDVWHEFDCDPAQEGGYDPGCAGWRPRQPFDTCAPSPLDADASGGDPFDLSDLGLSEVRFVRVRDRGGAGLEPSAGFDLDAVAAVHLRDVRP